MKKLTPLLLLLLIVSSCGMPDEAGEFSDRKMQVWGQTRAYRLYVPASIDLGVKNPVVFAYHGLNGNPNDMAAYSQLEKSSETDGYILIFPKAKDGQWGGESGMWNDLQFFDKMLRKLKENYKIDEQRVYAVGMSNGGYMCHKLAQRRSNDVAAICSHSGAMGLEVAFTGINADRKIPVMIAHGNKDLLISIKTARRNRDRYEEEGHPVRFMEMDGLGHLWGNDYNVNDSIWDFFSNYTLADK